MATASVISNLFVFLQLFTHSFFFLLLLCSSTERSYAFQGQTRTVKSKDLSHADHILQISSLLPSTVCKSSTKVIHEKSSLPIVDTHSPCSRLGEDQANNAALSHAEILRQDKARADSIHSVLSSQTSMANTSLRSIPGIELGIGRYQVTVGFGTPQRKLSLVFDTTSQLTWTQCQPCGSFCYPQNDPVFNPSKSTSYSFIGCQSETCNRVSSEGMRSGCNSASRCLYRVTYSNTSFGGLTYDNYTASNGYLSKETLATTSSDVFQGFIFGCGHYNRFSRGARAAGVLGLGRGWFSLLSQTADKYHKVFSYCLPTNNKPIGKLKFGDTPLPNSIKFTPMSKSFQGTHFYGLDITDIAVGGEKLSIDPSVFTTSGTAIDSASLITRLPPAAYSRVRRGFLAKMTNYPKAPALESLGTCFDFSGNASVVIPSITLYFAGGVEMPIDASGIMYVNNIYQSCLAFAKNDNDDDVTILGNFQQKGYEVVYDDANGRVGFAPGPCT